MRISDLSSDVCSSDLAGRGRTRLGNWRTVAPAISHLHLGVALAGAVHAARQFLLPCQYLLLGDSLVRDVQLFVGLLDRGPNCLFDGNESQFVGGIVQPFRDREDLSGRAPDDVVDTAQGIGPFSKIGSGACRESGWP